MRSLATPGPALRRAAVLTAAGVVALVALLGMSAPPAGAQVPFLRHVWVIVLENEAADVTFADDTEAPYLAKTLTAKGAFIPNYYGIAHLSLPNYIAMLSGQAANPLTQADCQTYDEFTPGTPTSDGQYVGQGCVYPPGVATIANQLEASGYSWRGYMQDMAASVPDEPATCRHPAIGEQDHTQSAEVNDQYAARHNPFVYFHSITDFPTCDANDVDLSRIYADLGSRETTPNYNFITPDLCNDGHDTPCINGDPGGLVQANTFLEGLVPKIMGSKAYKDHGAILITFDEAEGGTGSGDATACCNEQPGPNTPNPGALTPGPGGGRAGAVMVSPCIRGGTVTQHAYNHYSQLRSFEDNFGLPRLGFARQEGLRPFGTDILNRHNCGQSIRLKVTPKRVPAGRRVKVRFRVSSDFANCRGAGIKIRFAGRKLFTDSQGRAKVRLRLHRGLKRPRAIRPGCKKGRAKLRVARRR